MGTYNLDQKYDQIQKAKEDLASAKDGIALSRESYEIIDKILELTLMDIRIKKMYSQK